MKNMCSSNLLAAAVLFACSLTVMMITGSGITIKALFASGAKSTAGEVVLARCQCRRHSPQVRFVESGKQREPRATSVAAASAAAPSAALLWFAPSGEQLSQILLTKKINCTSSPHYSIP